VAHDVPRPDRRAQDYADGLFIHGIVMPTRGALRISPYFIQAFARVVHHLEVCAFLRT
jgi:hypothetical protein